MVQAVSLLELGDFLNLIVSAWDDYLYFAFVLMITFNIVMFIKHLVVGGRV